MYKKKADKVRLVDTSALDGSVLGGRVDWRDRAIAKERVVGKHIPVGKFDYWLYLRIVDFEPGTRLT